MPLHTAHYHWISCSAKVDNLVEPQCKNASSAAFGEADPIIEGILLTGWVRTKNGKDFLCPLHGAEAAAAPRKVRDATPAT